MPFKLKSNIKKILKEKMPNHQRNLIKRQIKNSSLVCYLVTCFIHIVLYQIIWLLNFHADLINLIIMLYKNSQEISIFIRSSFPKRNSMNERFNESNLIKNSTLGKILASYVKRMSAIINIYSTDYQSPIY